MKQDDWLENRYDSIGKSWENPKFEDIKKLDDKQLFLALLKNKEKYKILVDNDCVTVCKKEDWEQDIDVDFVDFNEYGYYLLNEIFLALGLDSEFV